MKVSYLIGVYNKLNYISDCVESILKEETSEIEIEICIVDDGSTDGSFKLIHEKFHFNSKIKIFKFEKNLGKNAAYNKAYEMSTGELICIFGADDVVVPCRTSKMVDSFLKNNKAVYGGLIIKNEDLSKEYSRKIPDLPSYYEISMFNFLSGGAGLVPKILCEEFFPIPENLKFEDWWVSYFLIKKNSVVILSDYVTVYRIGLTNDCATNGEIFYSYFKGIESDLSRHFKYIEEFMKKDNNPYLLKSLDIRNVFFRKTPNSLIYRELDKYTLMIIFMYLFGPKLFFRLFFLIKKVRKICKV